MNEISERGGTVKVIMVSYAPLAAHFEKAWMVADLEREGFQVEYWDLSALFTSGSSSAGLARAYVRKIISYADLAQNFWSERKNSVFLFLFQMYERRTNRVFRLVKKFHLRTAYFSWGNLPQGLRDGAKLTLSFQTLTRLWEGLLNRFIMMVSLKTGIIDPLSVAFYAGEQSRHGVPASRFVPVNMADFETFRRIKPAFGKRKEFAVFLDQNLPFHPDNQILEQEPIDAESYYEDMEAVFLRIESLLQLPVVVAAHPTANYESGAFSRREIIKGRTAELVYDSDLVIAHHTTAISFAILGLKPLLFVFTDEMQLKYQKSVVSVMASIADFLACPCVKVDEVGKVEHLPNVDRTRYEKYKYGYLTTEETEFSENLKIVVSTINELVVSP